jgi:cytosine/uracil/thiamine/allantoin permease
MSHALVDPERRQWKWWNYVTFWIADSLNIVRLAENGVLECKSNAAIF